MTVFAWLYSESMPEVLRAVQQRLLALGIRCVERSQCPAPGIVIVSAADAQCCDQIRELSRGGEAHVLAIYASERSLACDEAWSLLQAGAADVVEWATDNAAHSIVARLTRWSHIDTLLESPLVRDNLIGRSPTWRRVLRHLIEVAHFTDASVLITGESGTGKELAARLIHSLDPRPNKGELVILDCTTIVPELSGSEFFGHERGAFTGAIGSRDGAFAAADGGTLFLDEVGELPAAMQAQLLRVIQERCYKRVGGNQWHQTNFRLVCATNRNLQAEVGTGTFRPDLYYRLAGWTCELPPLRDRPEDILTLAQHFATHGTQALVLDNAVRAYLLQRAYPGNVRELRQLMTRIRARHVGSGPVTLGDLPLDERSLQLADPQTWRDAEFDDVLRRAVCRGAKLKELGQYATETAIRLALEEEQGNLQRAARRLGVTDRALQMRRANGQLGVVG